MVNIYCMIGMIIIVAKCIFWFVAIRKFEIKLTNEGFIAAIVSLVLDLILWPINLISSIIVTYNKTISDMMDDYMYEE